MTKRFMITSIKKPTNKRVLIIAGPTGVGESTITREIIKQYPIFKKLVTATTRCPRLKEKNKIDYYFFSKQKFEAEIKKGNILEYTYIKNRDTYYGSYKPELEKQLKKGFNIIANHDLIGARFFKKNHNAVTIFIAPGSLNDIKKRITHREPNISPIELTKRLKNAEMEIKKESPYYDYLVKNRQNQMDKAVEKILKIIKKEQYPPKIDKKR